MNLENSNILTLDEYLYDSDLYGDKSYRNEQKKYYEENPDALVKETNNYNSELTRLKNMTLDELIELCNDRYFDFEIYPNTEEGMNEMLKNLSPYWIFRCGQASKENSFKKYMCLEKEPEDGITYLTEDEVMQRIDLRDVFAMMLDWF